MILTGTRHSWTAPDGETFSYSRWEACGTEPGGEPCAVMVAVHGLSGAALDYEPLGRYLAPRGVTTYAPELRGQGNDPRPSRRGDLETLDDWFADLDAFLGLVRQRHPSAPLYCYGESMGAALLVRFFAGPGADTPAAGLILASPVVALPRRPAWWQETLFHFFLSIRPRHFINVRKLAGSKKNGPIKIVTRDEAHRKWFETAGHKLDSFTLRFFRSLFLLITGCREAAGKLRLPVLTLYATNDLFIPPARVEDFFDRLGSRDKERTLFPESYHLLLHDYDREQVLERIGQWLQPRLSGPGNDSEAPNPEPGLASGRTER
jgi:alpha-beta hydrolase superfamily lysophospholipase